MRFITLNEMGIVSSIRYGKEIVGEEIESDLGELGQRMHEDGTFEDVPQPQPEPKASIEEVVEETLLETKYQTFILEMMI